MELVQLTDAELDTVSAGQALIDVTAVDLVDINNNAVALQLNLPVAAAVAVLGAAGAVSTGSPGIIRQTT